MHVGDDQVVFGEPLGRLAPAASHTKQEEWQEDDDCRAARSHTHLAAQVLTQQKHVDKESASSESASSLVGPLITTRSLIQSIGYWEVNPLMVDVLMDVAGRPSPTLVEVLRSTLLRLEHSPDFSVDDPAFQEFKRSILRLMADLQLRKENTPLRKENTSGTGRYRPEMTSHSVLTLIVKPGQKLNAEQNWLADYFALPGIIEIEAQEKARPMWPGFSLPK
jgi:hypothetical protein